MYNAVPITNKKKRKVAAYARVSTDQEEQLTSYEAQVDYYTNYIKSRDDWEFVDVYTDEGISGKNIEGRPNVKRLIKDIKDISPYYLVTKNNLKLLVNIKDWTLEVNELPSKTNIKKFTLGQNKFINCGKLKQKNKRKGGLR